MGFLAGGEVGGDAVFILVESTACYGKYGNLNLVILLYLINPLSY